MCSEWKIQNWKNLKSKIEKCAKLKYIYYIVTCYVPIDIIWWEGRIGILHGLEAHPSYLKITFLTAVHRLWWTIGGVTI